jgi:transcriptional regulator with XRE-family HTH domain
MESWEKIRQAREAKGWSQDYLGKQVGISQPAVKKIEDGSTAHSKFLPRIAALLGLDIAELDEGLARITTSADRARGCPAGSTSGAYLAQGGPGELIVDASPIEYGAAGAARDRTRRLRGLRHRQLDGTGFRQGDIALVNPLPVVGDGAYFHCRAARASHAPQMAAAPDRRQKWFAATQPAARHEQGFLAVAQGMAEGAAGDRQIRAPVTAL